MAVNISGLRRNIKNVAHNYTDAQVKVREATSNDPWGPSSSVMSEIADMTYNTMAFSHVMQMIWKRLNDQGKNWRHVYKALVLLEYLIKTGSDKVAQQCRENIFALQALKEFQYLEENKDLGINVREKAKTIVSLLKDDERLKNERVRALKARERFIHASGRSHNMDYRFIGSSEFSGGRHATNPQHPSSSSAAGPNQEAVEREFAQPQTTGEEELQIQLALAMSREEAMNQESQKRSDDVRLSIALERSRRAEMGFGIDDDDAFGGEPVASTSSAASFGGSGVSALPIAGPSSTSGGGRRISGTSDSIARVANNDNSSSDNKLSSDLLDLDFGNPVGPVAGSRMPSQSHHPASDLFSAGPSESHLPHGGPSAFRAVLDPFEDIGLPTTESPSTAATAAASSSVFDVGPMKNNDNDAFSTAPSSCTESAFNQPPNVDPWGMPTTAAADVPPPPSPPPLPPSETTTDPWGMRIANDVSAIAAADTNGTATSNNNNGQPSPLFDVDSEPAVVCAATAAVVPQKQPSLDPWLMPLTTDSTATASSVLAPGGGVSSASPSDPSLFSPANQAALCEFDRVRCEIEVEAVTASASAAVASGDAASLMMDQQQAQNNGQASPTLLIPHSSASSTSQQQHKQPDEVKGKSAVQTMLAQHSDLVNLDNLAISAPTGRSASPFSATSASSINPFDVSAHHHQHQQMNINPFAVDSGSRSTGAKTLREKQLEAAFGS